MSRPATTPRADHHPSELAYAHAGGARLVVPPPRWPARVLFIESASSPGHPVQSTELHGIEILGYTDAIAALLAAPIEQPAAIVAPTDMIHVDFLSFIRAMHAWTEIPVIVGLAANEESTDLAYAAITEGARAIVSLPCRPDQLLSAVRACGARIEPPRGPLRVGALELDPDAFSARVAGISLTLTPREFLLMQYLMQASPRVVRPEDLASSTSTYDDGSVAATRVIVLKVRRKLEAALPGSGELLETVRSIGYRIAPADPAAARRSGADGGRKRCDYVRAVIPMPLSSSSTCVRIWSRIRRTSSSDRPTGSSIFQSI